MIIRVIDTETCGLPPNHHDIVEVATVDLLRAEDDDEKHMWTRGRMWTSLVNPGGSIPPEASAIHHIVDDMVKDAPTIDQLKDKIFADDGTGAPAIFAAHEAKFDRGALRLEDAGLRWICTRKSSMVAWPDAPNHKNQTLRYWLKLKLADPSLATPHRALGDCYVTAAILRRLLSAQDILVEDLVTLSANPIMLPRLTFGEHAMKPIDEVPLSYWQWIVEKSKGPWDEDVLHTARLMLNAGRAAQRNRSPV
jgi:exodeoxyribonuclease X